MNEYNNAKKVNMKINFHNVCFNVTEYEVERITSYKTTDTLTDTPHVDCTGIYPCRLKIYGFMYHETVNFAKDFEYIMKSMHGGIYSIGFDGITFNEMKLCGYKVKSSKKSRIINCVLDFTSFNSTGGIVYE